LKSKTRTGKYLLQLAFMGYQTKFIALEIPLVNGSDLGLCDATRPLSLNEVEVKAERVRLS
jgi:hypothetical protein